MAYTLDELTKPLTRSEVEAKIYTAIAALGTDTTIWKPGSPVRTMIAAVSIVVAAFSTLAAAVAKSGFLELAEKDWLTLVAYYVYGVQRIEATFASGYVTLTNAGGGVYSLDPGDLVLSSPTTGKTYRNAAAFTLAAMASTTIVVVAEEAGAASTAAPNTITQLVTALLGVTATNALSVVGRDAESDAALRTRSYEKLGSLSPNGPWDAYSFAVRSAVRSDGSAIGVSRVRTAKDGYGNVTTYVATPSGAVAGAANDLATDLGILAVEVDKKATPLAVTSHVLSATPVTVAVSYRVWLYNTSGKTEAQIKTAIDARLVEFMATQPIGGNIVGGDPGKVFVDAIRTTIGATLPQIFHVEVMVPAADVVLAVHEVPVLGAVTALSVTQVPPSEGGAA